jgi:uroporphyrinogen III methyltransferase/synthase
LFGLSIGVPRAEDQASGVLEQIVRGGGEPVPMPLLAIEPIGEAEAERVRGRLADLTGVDWLIFTSGNGVREFFRHLRLAGRDVRALGGVRVACVGSSTAASLAERGVVADLVPEKFRAESLVEALAGQVSGRRVVWVRGSRGRDVLPVQLSAAGAEVEQLVVYRNEDAAGLSAEVLERVRGGRLDWICLSSPAMAKRLAELLREAGLWPLPGTTRLATISQLTTAAAVESGLEVAAEAVESTWQGLLAALHFVNSSSNSA